MQERDLVLESFLKRQHADAASLAAASDLLRIYPYGHPPYQQYRAEYRCKGLVRAPGGEVVTADHFEALISFPDDYLRKANPYEVVAWLGPPNFFHPNVAPPVACVGHLVPGTRLLNLLYRIHEIIVYRKVTMNEFDALNHDACQWARANKHLFPIDTRPLKRRTLDLEIETAREVG